MGLYGGLDVEDIHARKELEVGQMSSVYEKCPVFENDKFLLRFANKDDASDLLKVYRN